MAQSIITPSSVNSNPAVLEYFPNSWRYRIIDDTAPYAECGVIEHLDNPHYDPVFHGKLRALKDTREGCWRSVRTLTALINDNPAASVDELVTLLTAQ